MAILNKRDIFKILIFLYTVFIAQDKEFTGAL